MAALLIAIVGAESTGKTTLAQALHSHLQSRTALRIALVPEWLRSWCEREARTPKPAEQAGIAAQQAALIEAAAQQHDVVICDTTQLMTAIYSELLFQDGSLLPQAQDFHQCCALTLLTATDLPWVADGLQRDGPHVLPVVDAALKRALQQAGVPYSIVSGQGPQRLAAALTAISAIAAFAPLLQRLSPANSLP